jgi:hypothetical protein
MSEVPLWSHKAFTEGTTSWQCWFRSVASTLFSPAIVQFGCPRPWHRTVFLEKNSIPVLFLRKCICGLLAHHVYTTFETLLEFTQIACHTIVE